jgi:hypothetical protein
MADQTVKLHGGPMQGRLVVLHEGANVLLVEGFDGPAIVGNPAQPNLEPRRVREGRYSRAHGSKTDFEWDGWK